MNKRLKGKVRDTQPNGKNRNWEIYFDKKLYGDDFPATHESVIEVEWPDGAYQVLVGIGDKNPIYLRTPANHMDYVRKDRIPDLYERHGLGRVGEIDFNRYFYVYEPQRALEVIQADIQAIESDIVRMLAETTGSKA